MEAHPIHQSVADWYRASGRDLPWRKPPFLGDPYAVLVSEVMLQQTQVDRTIPKFVEFMRRFPTIRTLAGAPVGEVITLWQGMGYNNRAVRLHKLAQTVVSEYDGDLPSGAEELRTLPGIGPYTAAAVACFAFGSAVPVLDTNIYRILSRLVHGVEPPERAAIEPLAGSLVPSQGAPLDASSWHQALMDIGATICSVQRPQCMLCPLREYCAAASVLQDGTDRKLAEASVPYAPKQGRFAGSTRFYRGRIVDALRGGGGVVIDDLRTKIAPEMAVASWGKLIDGLVKDGLAQREGQMVSLP